ncbi:MAG: 4'-phosphopantetheinyl transferase superfamily protein [Acidobacteriia bacterium]|nr:4'-phosphopantetheinyl transferase superfamily protein [Terriglobia bacterium]
MFQALERGACHLWHLSPLALPNGDLVERGMAFLSTDESARYARFLVPDAARTFLSARVLLRSVLSAYGDLAPAAWRFDTNPWGRPYIANAEAPARLEFNISHKPGLVVCFVGYGRDLGVDVEDASAEPAYLDDIASRFFSPSEVAALLALPQRERPKRFFQLWTLKESYIKARGMGLSLGLSGFSFTVDEPSATVRFEKDFADDPETWDFRLFRPDARHLIATSVRRSELPLTIEIRDAEDLVARAVGLVSK